MDCSSIVSLSYVTQKEASGVKSIKIGKLVKVDSNVHTIYQNNRIIVKMLVEEIKKIGYLTWLATDLHEQFLEVVLDVLIGFHILKDIAYHHKFQNNALQ